jgi:hypothetical protein
MSQGPDVPPGMRRIRRCVVMASMWIFGALLLSVLPCTSATGQDRPVFSSEADLVVLHVNVKDRKGPYVAGLKQEAFSILEDGRAQTIQFFTGEDAAVSRSFDR